MTMAMRILMFFFYFVIHGGGTTQNTDPVLRVRGELKSQPWQGSNLQPSDPKSDALPLRHMVVAPWTLRR